MTGRNSKTKNAYSLDTKIKLAKKAMELEKIWLADKANPLLPDPKRRGTLRRKDKKWGYINRNIDENIPKLRGRPGKVSHSLISNQFYCFTFTVNLSTPLCSRSAWAWPNSLTREKYVDFFSFSDGHTVTCFTIFFFKLSPPAGVHVQWSPSGWYRLGHI